jgi:hypothetical protein
LRVMLSPGRGLHGDPRIRPNFNGLRDLRPAPERRYWILARHRSGSRRSSTERGESLRSFAHGAERVACRDRRLRSRCDPGFASPVRRRGRRTSSRFAALGADGRPSDRRGLSGDCLPARRPSAGCALRKQGSGRGLLAQRRRTRHNARCAHRVRNRNRCSPSRSSARLGPESMLTLLRNRPRWDSC